MGRHDTPDRKSAIANEVMLDLLYGPNPITDDELRALIKKRPALYAKYAGYLGKRPGQGAKRDPGRSRTWVTFTKRTEEPKLSWLEGKLKRAGIRSRRKGWSFHAPILEVQKADLDRAWAILDPVDDVRDDHPMFRRGG